MDASASSPPHAANDEATQARKAKSPAIVIAALIAAQLAAADGITSIYAMLPTIYREFPGQEATVGWIVTAFFIVAAMSAALGGRLADLLGRRSVAIAIMLIAGVGAVIGMFAGSPEMLVVASLMLGATTTLTPILIGMAREALPASRVSLGISAIAGAGMIGAGMIYVVCGYLVDNVGRMGGYALFLVLAIISASLLKLAVPRSQPSGFRMGDIDFVRGVLFGPAAAGIILSIELIAADGFATVPLAILGGSLLLLAYWVRNQLTQSRPLMDLRLMTVGNLPRTFLVMVLLGLAGIEQGQVYSLLLQQDLTGGAGFGFSAMGAGWAMLVITSASLIAAPLAGAACQRIGARAVAMIGAALIAVTWVVAALTLGSLAALLATGFVAIAGLAWLSSANYVLIVEDTPAELTSGAAGLGYTMYNLAFAAGSQAVLSMLHGRGKAAGALPDAGDYRQTMFILAAVSSLMVVALLFNRRRY